MSFGGGRDGILRAGHAHSIVWKDSNIRLVHRLHVINRLLSHWIVILAGCLVISVNSVASAQVAASPERRVIQPEDIMGLTDISDVEIAPDGRHLLYVTQPTIATARASRSAIWIVAADGRAPARSLTDGVRRDGSPQWSPNGSSIAFLSNRPDAGARGAGSEPAPPALADVRHWCSGAAVDGADPRHSRLSLVAGRAKHRDPRPGPANRCDEGGARGQARLDGSRFTRDPTRLWILDLPRAA